MAVQKDQPMAPTPVNESSAVLSMIARAASDPNTDMDKMERLMAMHERMLAQRARADFDAALAELQVELPSIGERGNAADRYTFALWEDINKAIKPILQKHGFSLSFRMDTTSGVTVTGVLSHRNGHREETTITLPPDPSGNKPAVQAVASSVSYGKRYTAGALLNLTSHGEDDDAFGASSKITEEQEAELRELAESVGADLPRFLAYMKVGSLSAIPAKDFNKAKSALKAKAK
jgi:hypothetical protein